MMSELFRNVLNASFQGSVVIAAVLVLRLVLKKAPKKYICLLWILAGLRLLMPFSIESNLSLQPHVEQVELDQVVSVQVPKLMQPMFPQPEALVAESDISKSNAEVPNSDVEVQPPKSMEQTSFLYKVEDDQIDALTFGDLASAFWLAGVGTMLLYGVVSYGLLKRRVREAVRMDGFWESAAIDTAFILGYFRPRIYLPLGLTGQEQEMILSHEKCHLKRLDHWTKLLGFAALAVHWFNPLVWLAFACLGRDIELACDEQVVDGMALPERKAYSAALLRCSSTSRHLAACPVAFGEKPVKRRIKAVLNYKKPAFWLTVVAVAAIVFVAVFLLTSPKEIVEEKDTPEEQTVVPKILWKESVIENLYQELERIQNSEEIAFDVSTTTESDFEFFRGHEQSWWFCGDEWYRVFYYDTNLGTYTEEYVQTDGKQYARREADHIPKLGDLEWTQLPDGQVELSPLLTRDWTTCEVLEVRKEESVDGGVVTVVLQGDMEPTSKKTYYEHTHEFHLDENGRLVGVVEYSFVDQYINYLGTEGRFYIKGRSNVRFKEIKPGVAEEIIKTALEEVWATMNLE